MADPLQVELVSADRVVWSGEAREVLTRTLEGEIGILAGHTPLLGALAPGTVEVRSPGDDRLLAAVDGGFISVAKNHISILAERVLLSEEIDVDAARSELSAAEEAQGSVDSSDEQAKVRAGQRVAAARALVDTTARASSR